MSDPTRKDRPFDRGLPDKDRPYPTEEPPAGVRQMAATMREWYVAFLQAGFTRAEALDVLAAMLKSFKAEG